MEVTYALLNITQHHQRQPQQSSRLHNEDRRGSSHEEMPAVLAAIESAERYCGTLQSAVVLKALRLTAADSGGSGGAHRGAVQGDIHSGEPSQLTATRLHAILCRRVEKSTSIGSGTLAWMMRSPESLDDHTGQSSHTQSSMPVITLAQELRMIADAAQQSLSPYLPHQEVVIEKGDSSSTGGELGHDASLLEVCLHKRRAVAAREVALSELSSSDKGHTDASASPTSVDDAVAAAALYIASLPFALEELHQQARIASQERLIETGDSSSQPLLLCGGRSSLLYFLLCAERTDDEAVEPLHQAQIVMLIEPLMGEEFELAGALKRLRYHFRQHNETVEVASEHRSDPTTTTAPPAVATAPGVESDVDEDSVPAESPATDNDAAGTTLSSATHSSLLSLASPEHFLSYALGLAADSVSTGFGDLLATAFKYLTSTCAEASTVRERQWRIDVEGLLRARVMAMTGFLFWSAALDQFTVVYEWERLVSSMAGMMASRGNIDGSDDTSVKRRSGALGESKRQQLTRRFIHMCNCLFDLSRHSTIAHHLDNANNNAVSHFSAVIGPVVLQKLFLPRDGAALRLWCHANVDHLMSVCSDEASPSPTLWRRQFLIASRRAEQRHAHYGETDDGGARVDDAPAAAPRLSHHALSPVVVKFFRGLSAAVNAVLTIVPAGDDKDDDTAAFYITARRCVWQHLVCRGVHSFGSLYDVGDATNHHLIQTYVSDHCDRLHELLHLNRQAGNRERTRSSDEQQLPSPSDLLAMLFMS